MLAKELRIQTLKKQREYIEKKLRQAAKSNDGDLSYLYVGYLHPEVKSHFEVEGYDVVVVKSEYLTVVAKGRPVYLFTPKDFNMTNKEIKQAEEYNYEKDKPVAEQTVNQTDEQSEESELMGYILGTKKIGQGHLY